ncbi:anti-sigma factor [Sphingomonas sp. SUN019]|uniref:anti-sigma factor family protein n=1 Tax=Sphingomonas sp. SUN019 TaxID=2937788 RepID=UPI00216437A3|nr:anti-sigma factor [Sphingomonas sp. SUN019]UVO49023.1 anti-sigma factor [Sphingomonas sp. SUN019]
MTIDPETLMAYADGELDQLAAKRVERAIAADPALAEEVVRHRALRSRIGGSFAAVLNETAPERLTALLQSNVVALPPRTPRSITSRWREAVALAACLVLGLSIGLGVQRGPVAARSDGLYASGRLARALDSQPSGVDGGVKVAVSFRDNSGEYCRVFAFSAAAGIACRDDNGWALRQTRAGSPTTRSEYRQAGSPDADLMAAAQDMMVGNPLDQAAEAKARGAGWR